MFLFEASVRGVIFQVNSPRPVTQTGVYQLHYSWAICLGSSDHQLPYSYYQCSILWMALGCLSLVHHPLCPVVCREATKVLSRCFSLTRFLLVLQPYFKPFISVSVVRTSLILRQAFECANRWFFWRRLDHKLEQRTEENEVRNVDCVRKQKQWSWTSLLFRRIHLGDLGIHICIRWSIPSQYDLKNLWTVLPNLESPSNSQLYAYEICERIDKEIEIYVTFIPVLRIMSVLSNRESRVIYY